MGAGGGGGGLLGDAADAGDTGLAGVPVGDGDREVWLQRLGEWRRPPSDSDPVGDVAGDENVSSSLEKTPGSKPCSELESLSA